MGIPYGAPNDPTTLLALVARLPPGSVFSAFSIGRMQLPYVALAALAGGNVRVGLEDNLYLSRGVLGDERPARRAGRDDPRGDERPRPRPRRGPREARAWSGMADRPRTVALLGGGVIGGGWAARFALNGADVRLYDPAPEAERHGRRGARERAARAAPADARAAAGRGRGDARGDAWRRRSTASTSCRRARPSARALKRDLLAAASRAAPPDAVIATSTSGLLPTPAPGGHGAPRAVHGRPPVQPRLPPAARRAVRRRADRGRDARARRRGLPLGRDAAARPAPRDRRVRRRPPARGAVARGAVARRRRGRDRRGDRRRDPLRRRAAVGVHGHVPHVPDRRRHRRDEALHGAVRPDAEAAVDEADGRPRAHRRPARHASSPSPTRRPTAATSASSSASATTASSR